MTISSENRKSGPFLGTGAVSEYPFNFVVFSNADLLVIMADTSGAESTLVLTSGYTVALNSNQDSSPGGTVLLTAPLPSDYLLVITSKLANLQPTDLTNQGGFYPQVVTRSLDRLTILVQQLKESSSRALTIPISSSVTPQAFLDELITTSEEAIAAAAAIQKALADFTIPSAATLIGVDDGVSGARYTTLAGRLTYMRTGNGALDVGTLASGTGATARTLQAKLRDFIHVDDYGALGGSADDTTAFQNALNQAAALGGGQVHFSRNHRILSTLTIPLNVALVGPLKGAGQLQPGDSLADFDAKAGVIRLASAATISILASGGLAQCILVRDGLDLPFSSEVTAKTGIAAFAGTAITGGGADVILSDLLILGFERAYDSNNHARANITNVQGDCTNGIRILAARDTVYLLNCHFWPFTTANFSWTASDATQEILMRGGIAYEMASTVDWPKITNCFSYGYFRGFRLHNTNAVSMIGCAVDGPVNSGAPRQAGSIGVLLEGTSVDNKITSMYVAGKTQGYANNATSGDTEYVSCDAVACTIGCDNLNAQRVKWIGGLLRNCSYAFQQSFNGAFRIDGAKVRDYLTKPINVAVSTTNLTVTNIDFIAPGGGAAMADNAANWLMPTIASADPMNLSGNGGDNFLISGTTNFGTLNGGYPGRTVMLFFDGALTVLNGGSMRLNGSANFVTAAGSSLTLTWAGTQWREVGRCA